MTGCQCSSSGFCKHLNREMPEPLYNLCRLVPEYYDLFRREAGEAVGDTPKKQEITGLGDVVESVATKTGIKWLAKQFERITGKPCGCGKRKKWLNEKFPKKK